MLKKLLSSVFAFLFPGQCLICQKESNHYLCFECFKKIKLASATCLSCGQASKLGQFCPTCQKKFYLDGVLVAGDLADKNLAQIIKAFKYHFLKELAWPLSSLLVKHLQGQVIKNPLMPSSQDNFKIEDLVLLAVPLSKRRERWRGFNQSHLLAQKVSSRLNIEYWNYLKRVKYQKPQVNLKKKERQLNLKDAFAWSGPSLRGKKAIVIDDIATTGATLNEIARELKKQEALEVWGLVLAHGSSQKQEASFKIF